MTTFMHSLESANKLQAWRLIDLKVDHGVKVFDDAYTQSKPLCDLRREVKDLKYLKILKQASAVKTLQIRKRSGVA